MIKYIKEQEFEKEVLKEDGLVIVDFFATWCGPCKMLSPVLDEVDAIGKNIKIIKSDIDVNPNIAEQYEIKSVPTLKLFKGGEIVKTQVGLLTKSSLLKLIDDYS